MHIAFIGAFGFAGKTLLRVEVANARKRAQDAADDLADQTESEARALGLAAPPADPDIMARVTALRQTFTQVLVMTRKAVNANSAILMTRDDSYDALQVFAAATPETEHLTAGSAPLSTGLLAVLGRLEPEGNIAPVLRLSPLEGRNRELPYYEHTPARIRSVMAVMLTSGDHVLGALLFDRCAGAGFEDADLPVVRNAATLLARLLETERALLATEHHSSVMTHLLDAHHALAEAFGPEQMYQAVLDAANRVTPLRFGALLVTDERTGRPRIVNAVGERAHECVGHALDSATSLGAMVIKTPTIVPPSRSWHPAHGSLLGTDSGPKLREGDPVIAVPLVVKGNPIGAMVLLGRQKFDNDAVNVLRLLAGSAAVAVEHAKALAELESRATTDALTGLDNRPTILTKLDQTLARAGRCGQSVATMVLDIDHFKRVNDNHGHLLGDKVLREVSAKLQDSKRLNDSVGRWGGEEFVIVLEDTDADGARLVAERIRTNVSELTFQTEDGPFSVTASIGIAISPTHADQREPLLKKADRALYLAKDGGRDQVVVHGDRPHSGAAIAP